MSAVTLGGDGNTTSLSVQYFGKEIPVTFTDLLACGDDEFIFSWIRDGGDKERTDERGNTPLMLAAAAGRLRAVQMLLDVPAVIASKEEDLGLDFVSWKAHGKGPLSDPSLDLEEENCEGKTALMCAVANGHVEVVKLLKSRGAVAESTSLILAAQRADRLMTQCLSKMGARLDKDEGCEALLNAARSAGEDERQKEVVRVLVDLGAGKRDHDGFTPLIRMASEGRLSVVSELLKGGVEVNARDNTGKTALMHAIQWKHERVVSMLFEHGADVRLTSRKGEHALTFAHQTQNSAIMRLVLDKVDEAARQSLPQSKRRRVS